MLNIPYQFEQQIVANLQEGQTVLLMGMGGYDIVSCLPLYYTLRKLGYDVRLANYSLTDFGMFPEAAEPDVYNELIYGANARIKKPLVHFPEGYLSLWFKEGFGEDATVWMLRKQTPIELRSSLSLLIKNLNVGVMIFCGTGLKGLMTGDEEGCGEMVHSTVLLAGSSHLPVKKMMCLTGLNTHGKRSESLSNALDNLSILSRMHAYYGTCSLTSEMESLEYYKSAYTFISEQPTHEKNVGHEIVITAALGGYGTHKDGGFVCPIMSQVHFLEADAIIQRNIIIPRIEHMENYSDMVQECLQIVQGVNNRPKEVVPA